MFLALALGLSACSSDVVFLPALLEQSFADLEIGGAELTSRTETPQSEGVQLTRASVMQVFRILDANEADMLRDELVEMAQEDGWSFESLEPNVTSVGGEVLQAYKEVSTGRIGLSLTFVREGIDMKLVVVLNHLGQR